MTDSVKKDAPKPVAAPLQTDVDAEMAASQSAVDELLRQAAVEQGAHDDEKDSAQNDPKLVGESWDRLQKEAEESAKERQEEKDKARKAAKKKADNS